MPAGRTVLFLCVANSARSQMAEGLARELLPKQHTFHSAGSCPGSLNPFAVKAMAEIGIDISGHHSKAIDSLPIDEVGVVITLCAEEVCPTFSRAVEKVHWPFDDPAAAEGKDDAILRSFCRVRDELRAALLEGAAQLSLV